MPALLVAAGVAGLLWAVPHLEEGITEVPSHWWSMLAALPLVVGTPWLGWVLADPVPDSSTDAIRAPRKPGGRRGGR
ncbi:MAG: hypothetical protein ACRD2W_01960 [Acidimicrobiales bacterium]